MTAFAGKHIVITGAAGGIGSECARLFLAEGANVLLIDPLAEPLRRVADTLAGSGRVTTVVSRLESPQACSEALAAIDGPLHALVHSAGIFVPDGELGAAQREVYDDVIAANVTNAYDLALACVPRFDPDSLCRMVFLSSLAYRRGSFDHIAYSIAKGGIAGLVRALSKRLAPDVLVNGLAPGVIDTPMPQHIIDDRLERILAEVPLKRIGQAHEVASVILFLCGAGSTYITGQIINVDGGVNNA